MFDRLRQRLRRWERRTRPDDPVFAAALARRWAELPAVARTPGQVLGRFGVGCEGTHRVFPACNLACTPCYHSREANRGRLLPPDDHAAALAIMRRHGREPMSMTNGDVDYAYLEQLVSGPDGRRRLDRVSFAGHFDSMMFGRRGIARPPDEASLHPYRRRFVAQFARLRREYGVRSFLAHTMTVTPANVGEVAEVARAAGRMGFGMLSFQPAAHVGDDRRRHGDYRDAVVSADVVRRVGVRPLLRHGARPVTS
jgi:hypothetical protein